MLRRFEAGSSKKCNIGKYLEHRGDHSTLREHSHTRKSKDLSADLPTKQQLNCLGETITHLLDRAALTEQDAAGFGYNEETRKIEKPVPLYDSDGRARLQTILSELYKLAKESLRSLSKELEKNLPMTPFRAKQAQIGSDFTSYPLDEAQMEINTVIQEVWKNMLQWDFFLETFGDLLENKHLRWIAKSFKLKNTTPKPNQAFMFPSVEQDHSDPLLSSSSPRSPLDTTKPQAEHDAPRSSAELTNPETDTTDTEDLTEQVERFGMDDEEQTEENEDEIAAFEKTDAGSESYTTSTGSQWDTKAWSHMKVTNLHTAALLTFIAKEERAVLKPYFENVCLNTIECTPPTQDVVMTSMSNLLGKIVIEENGENRTLYEKEIEAIKGWLAEKQLVTLKPKSDEISKKQLDKHEGTTEEDRLKSLATNKMEAFFASEYFTGTWHCETILLALQLLSNASPSTYVAETSAEVDLSGTSQRTLLLPNSAAIEALKDMRNHVVVSKRCCPACTSLVKAVRVQEKAILYSGGHPVWSAVALPPWLLRSEAKKVFDNAKKTLEARLKTMIFQWAEQESKRERTESGQTVAGNKRPPNDDSPGAKDEAEDDHRRARYHMLNDLPARSTKRAKLQRDQE